MKNNYIYGLHTVLARLKHHPETIQCLYVLEKRQDKVLQKIRTLAQQQNINLQTYSRSELDKRVAGANHQGVIATIAEEAPVATDLESVIANIKPPALILVLDGIQDPHNLGACLRSADAAGVDVVIAPKDNAVAITPTVRKIACGAAETVPFFQVTNLARTLKQLQQQGIWIYGLAAEAQYSLYDVDYTGSVALVMGAEGKGLRQLTKTTCDELVSLPLLGSVTSLNVSVATGITLYEVLRQRQGY